MITVSHIRRGGLRSIGVAIERFILDHPHERIISICPTMLTYFSTAPERYEVSEVTIITEAP